MQPSARFITILRQFGFYVHRSLHKRYGVLYFRDTHTTSSPNVSLTGLGLVAITAAAGILPRPRTRTNECLQARGQYL